MDCVKEIFLFDGLTDTERKDICETLGEPKHFQKGSVISKALEFSNSLGIMLSGRAVAKSGRVVKRRFERGDVFGVSEMFGGSGYLGSIEAAAECFVLFVSEEKIRELFAEFPKTAENYITFLSSRVRFLNQKLDCLAAGDAKEKLYRHLEASAQGGEFQIKDMTYLAKQIGLGRTSLYRALSELEAQSLVKREKNIIKIL